MLFPGPEVPPDNIRVSTLEHITEIKLEWERIPPEYHNGILRGYYIEYTATILAGQNVPTDKRVVQSKRIRGNRYSTVLTDLDPGSTYEISIFGYTIKNGTKSNITVGGMFIYYLCIIRATLAYPQVYLARTEGVVCTMNSILD